jgi:hypothetical protein
MESLATALAVLFNHRIGLGKPQWYALDIDAQHLSGLSKLLEMTSEEYIAVSLLLGWMKSSKRRDQVVHSIQPTAMEAFFRSDIIPFDPIQI